jgi:hypothetical protein
MLLRQQEVTMDEDLMSMSLQALQQEVQKLRDAIRTHRDASEHELCWHHPDLWRLLPEKTDPVPAVPSWPVFMQGCVRYRQSLDRELPDVLRTDKPAAQA